MRAALATAVFSDAPDAARYRAIRALTALPIEEGHAAARSALEAAGLEDIRTPDLSNSTHSRITSSPLSSVKGCGMKSCMTLGELRPTYMAQTSSSELKTVKCPMCGTLQNGRDFFAAGAGID